MSEPSQKGQDIADHEQARAAALVDELGSALRRAGWDYVVLAVSRCVEDDVAGCVMAPGATFFASTQRMVPGLPREADGLRRIAERLDEAFRKSGCEREATEGYAEDVTSRYRQ
jgi:hypothetical protein